MSGGQVPAWLPVPVAARRFIAGGAARAVCRCAVRGEQALGRGLAFQQGPRRRSPDAVAAAKDTATNPAVLTAFALAIIAAGGAPAYPGIPGREPDLTSARRDAGAINMAMGELRKLVPDGGSYVSETNYFEGDWQRSFWEANYPRLRAVKATYDPDGLFFVHHGVGSEDWSDDGFTRLPK